MGIGESISLPNPPFVVREPQLFAGCVRGWLASGSAETHRIFRYRANRRSPGDDTGQISRGKLNMGPNGFHPLASPPPADGPANLLAAARVLMR
jgi:hypothetical protein